MSSNQIELNWYEDITDVIEIYNERSFMIGTVALDTLANAVVGFTYYHHMISVVTQPEGFVITESDGSVKGYRKILRLHERKVGRLVKRIRRIHRDYPEIDKDRLVFDNSENAMFIDLKVSETFPIPLLRSNHSFISNILERVRFYSLLLGTIDDYEILKK